MGVAEACLGEGIMPKVTYPLLSGRARGRLGKDLIYYSDGYVRSWSVQNDPKTRYQLRFRTLVRGLMQMIKAADGLDRAWLRKQFARSWHTRLVSWVTVSQLARARALHDAWSALSSAERQAWESAVPGV